MSYFANTVASFALLNSKMGELGSDTSELTTVIGDLVIKIARYDRTWEAAREAEVYTILGDDPLRQELANEIHQVRKQVQAAWRAWVLEATVEAELADVRGLLAKQDVPKVGSRRTHKRREQRRRAAQRRRETVYLIAKQG